MQKIFELDYSTKHKSQSSGMGLTMSKEMIEKDFNEPFFVMNGDLLTNVNFERLLNYHLLADAEATMCVREYDFKVPYGVVNIEKGQITLHPGGIPHGPHPGAIERSVGKKETGELAVMIEKQLSKESIIQRMNQLIMTGHINFTIENLIHLMRSGRLSKTKALIGTVLRVKPLLEQDSIGRLTLHGSARTHKKVMEMMINNIKQTTGKHKNSKRFCLYV